MGDYGEFEEVIEGEDGNVTSEGENGEVVSRVKLPGKGEFIGKVVQRYGGNRMEILCSDGKSRNCRVPGRFKRKMWLRPGDIVIIEPWPDNDDKGEIIFQYYSSGVNQLRKKGLLDNLNKEF